MCSYKASVCVCVCVCEVSVLYGEMTLDWLTRGVDMCESASVSVYGCEFELCMSVRLVGFVFADGFILLMLMWVYDL